jgi:hypothetical protein
MLACAYCALVATALAVVARDASRRSDIPLQTPRAENHFTSGPAMPLPITPIAQSPFPEARPGQPPSGEHIAKITKPRSRPSRGQAPFHPAAIF